MSSLKNFYITLNKIVKGRPIRPFVCSGNPLDTEILIVGFNPATGTDDFWNYFDDEYGFHKDEWLISYKENRKKSGKKNELSNSRRVMEWIGFNLEQQNKNIKIMETNIYAYPTAKKSELSKDEKSEVFDFLISMLKPKLILTHGVDAKNYIQELNLDVPVINEKHFAIGWSREKAKEVAEQIIKILDE